MDEYARPDLTSDPEGTGSGDARQDADLIDQAVRNATELSWEEPQDPGASGDAEVEPDEPGDGFEGLDDATDDAPADGGVAREAQHTIRKGIAAFRDVRAASQRHASAREELRAAQDQLDAHTAELRHRIDIEERYPQIIAQQSEELAQAQADIESAAARVLDLEARRSEFEDQLAAMTREHEDQLRPYRNVAESARGRADDTARALADARRATKSAESVLADATRRRDQRISTANRAVDNAQERLRNVAADLDAAQHDEEASPDAVQRLSEELARETARLESTRAEVVSVTEEARNDVETAQQRLFDQRRLLGQAEREADASKREATARKAEYDELLRRAQEAEKALQAKIRDLVAGSEQASRDRSDAEARVKAAQEALGEAEAIHSTPQQTIDLREQVLRDQTDLDQHQDTVNELAANERDLRRGTFRQRLLVVVAGIAIVAAVIAVVAAVVLGRARRNAADETPAAHPTAVAPATPEKTDEDDEESGQGADKEPGDTASTAGASRGGSDKDGDTEATSGD